MYQLNQLIHIKQHHIGQIMQVKFKQYHQNKHYEQSKQIAHFFLSYSYKNINKLIFLMIFISKVHTYNNKIK